MALSNDRKSRRGKKNKEAKERENEVLVAFQGVKTVYQGYGVVSKSLTIATAAAGEAVPLGGISVGGASAGAICVLSAGVALPLFAVALGVQVARVAWTTATDGFRHQQIKAFNAMERFNGALEPGDILIIKDFSKALWFQSAKNPSKALRGRWGAFLTNGFGIVVGTDRSGKTIVASSDDDLGATYSTLRTDPVIVFRMKGGRESEKRRLVKYCRDAVYRQERFGTRSVIGKANVTTKPARELVNWGKNKVLRGVARTSDSDHELSDASSASYGIVSADLNPLSPLRDENDAEIVSQRLWSANFILNALVFSLGRWDFARNFRDNLISEPEGKVDKDEFQEAFADGDGLGKFLECLGRAGSEVNAQGSIAQVDYLLNGSETSNYDAEGPAAPAGSSSSSSSSSPSYSYSL